jgi:hypothetical protein
MEAFAMFTSIRWRCVPDSIKPRLALRPRSAMCFVVMAAAIVAAVPGAALGQSVMVAVPGTGNPWLAGMPDGASASGDTAPGQSPARVPLAIAGGRQIRFTAATGMTGYADGVSCPAEGCPYPGLCHSAENGIGGVCWGMASCLTGVFLSDAQPDLTEAPATLDFNSDQLRGFATLAPGLKQVFYIGDGRTADQTLQVFTAPAGATRLFLGSADGTGWYNNVGVFTVTVEQSAATCPADYDHNGHIEPADVAAFVNTWFTSLQSGTLAGDFDGNGRIEPADVAAFVNAWFAALTTPC